MENKNVDYNLMLFNLIKKLDKFERKCGGEGSAYFVDNDFVVKRYENIHETQERFYENFDLYCKEMQRYASDGFPVPKVYAWLMVPAPRDSRVKKYCYILEERVKGRELFYDCLDSFYSTMKNFYSEDDYLDIIEKPEQKKNAFVHIVENFVNDFISMNNYIANMSEIDLASFLCNIYCIEQTGKYSLPDYYPSNVIINKNEITMIDNVSYKRDRDWETKEYLDSVFWSGIISLFSFNDVISNPQGSFLSDYQKFIPELECLRSGKLANLKECKEAIMRVIKLIKKYCDNPELSETRLYDSISRTLRSIFSKEDAHEIVSEITK